MLADRVLASLPVQLALASKLLLEERKTGHLALALTFSKDPRAKNWQIDFSADGLFALAKGPLLD